MSPEFADWRLTCGMQPFFRITFKVCVPGWPRTPFSCKVLRCTSFFSRLGPEVRWPEWPGWPVATGGIVTAPPHPPELNCSFPPFNTPAQPWDWNINNICGGGLAQTWMEIVKMVNLVSFSDIQDIWTSKMLFRAALVLSHFLVQHICLAFSVFLALFS